MIAALKRLFSPDPIALRAHEAYSQIMAQARQAIFFAQWQVEDSFDGRFDVLVLHMFLVIDALSAAPGNEYFTRALSEAFFADMDRTLREMGVTDTGVSVRMKKIAKAFYGRFKAYEEAGDDGFAWIDALRRNVYREREVSESSSRALADYVLRNKKSLRAQPLPALLNGAIAFVG